MNPELHKAGVPMIYTLLKYRTSDTSSSKRGVMSVLVGAHERSQVCRI